MTMNKKRLGVYIHIPFCIKKCNYCDFLSFACDDETKAEYCRALVREIDLCGEDLSDKEKLTDKFAVDTVFFGGGTPSILEAEYIIDIMKKLKSTFEFFEDAEISIECNPGSLNYEKLFMYKEAEINRISMGLQSTNDAELKMLGRIHTYREFEHNYELARRVGFDNINIDIMSALPGQTRESYITTLENVIKLNPEHISAYSLILEKGTPMYDMFYAEEGTYIYDMVCGEEVTKYILPDEDTEREMYYDTEHILGTAGYNRYEISNYSKPGYECRHNIGYWTGKDYVGFGIGAASYLNGIRYNNLSDIKMYMKCLAGCRYNEAAKCITENIHKLTERERMEEFMFLGLRLTNGVSKSEFERRFRVGYDKIYGNVSVELTEKQLLNVDGDYVRLTGKGIDVSNYVLSYFIL